MMTIRPSSGNARAYQLLSEWPERVPKFMAYFTYLAAKQAYANVIGKMPNSDEWRMYKRSLKLARISGMTAGFAIKADVKSGGGGKQKEPVKEVVYVRPAKRSRKKDKRVAVLERYNPWTWDTLPFTPSKRQATLVTRKVRTREMAKVAALRNGDRKKWSKALRRVGARVRKKGLSGASAKAKVVPDIAFEALRLEFGLGGAKSKAHWRPGIKNLVSSGLHQIGRRSDIQAALTDPSFGGWRSWPPSTKGKSSISEAQGFAAFQKKLGI
jgi:hypothetical protein